MRILRTLLALLFAAALSACGDDATPVDAGSDSSLDAGDASADAATDAALDSGVDARVDSGTDAGADAGAGCVRVAPTGDGAHSIVVSHPFDAAGMQDTRFELLELSATGEISQPGTIFRMGRAFDGDIVFTPDGELGFVAQEDGTVGIFRVEAGAVTVLDASFSGDFYAERVVMDPAGDALWVVDAEFPDIGGGLYRLPIGCDGALGAATRVLSAKLPYDIAFFGGRALVSAREAPGTSAGDDAVLYDAADGALARLSSVDAFGDENAIVSDVAVTDDGTYGLLADNCGFCGDNRLGVVGISGDALTVAPKIAPFDDPVAIVPSPFDDLVLIVSGFGNAVFVYDRADPPAAPFTLRGELTYMGAPPQLPEVAARVDRGGLRGLVLLSENLGVRRLRFTGAGGVEDLGLTPVGSGTESVVGALGVSP